MSKWRNPTPSWQILWKIILDILPQRNFLLGMTWWPKIEEVKKIPVRSKGTHSWVYCSAADFWNFLTILPFIFCKINIEGSDGARGRIWCAADWFCLSPVPVDSLLPFKFLLPLTPVKDLNTGVWTRCISVKGWVLHLTDSIFIIGKDPPTNK